MAIIANALSLHAYSLLAGSNIVAFDGDDDHDHGDGGHGDDAHGDGD